MINSKAGVVILGLGWAVASCRREAPPAPTGPLVEQRGDTTVVTTRGDGKWGPPRDAKPLLRVTGPGGTQTFGEVYQIAVLPNGHLLVFDSKGTSGPALLEFGEDGRFLKKIGRDGSGPGEYSAAMTLSVAPDGAILASEREMDQLLAIGEGIAKVAIEK